MGKTKYSPRSRFLTIPGQLISTVQDSDAFGPVKNSEQTKYRITSFVRATDSSTSKPIYSINKGQIAIIPGGADKINLVVKNLGTYDPFKIKYFVYRGLTKSDFIDANGMIVPYTSDKPQILNTLWINFWNSNNLAHQSNVPFPASLFGYDEGTSNDNKSLDELFLRKIDLQCDMGTVIGSFKDRLGLDIILDEGEYITENQQAPLFNINVKYSRGEEFVFDISSVGTDAVKIKRYKEYIHQFIDAAAFWGSHIKDGKVFIDNNEANAHSSISAINTNFLEKYVTKGRIYLYIKNNDNRTFNYYKPKKVLDFENAVMGRNYSTYGWPILFNVNSLENETLVDETTDYPMAQKTIQLQCDVDTNDQGRDSATGYYNNKIIPRDQYLAVHNWQDIGNGASYSLENNIDGPSGAEGQGPNGEKILTYNEDIKYYKLGNVVSSNFIMLSTSLEQTFPMKLSCNRLWIPNINTPFPSRATNFKAYKATYDKKLNVNLKDVLRSGAIVKQDVIFDSGKNSSGGQKKRRLYITSIRRNFNEKHNIFNDLNIDSQGEMVSDNMNNLENYLNFLYGNQNFNLYRGSFNDGNQKVYSLSLVSNESHFSKNSYFQLGITEDDYNKIFSTANQSIFNGSENFFFFLEEVQNFSNDLVRKFKLGVNYENNLGNLVTFFPTVQINIYSLDGLFFFSKDYSDYQQFYIELSSKAVANFRPLPDYDGEFGFDWVRMGDSGTFGDTNGSGGKPDRTYKALFGNYYKSSSSNEKAPYNDIPPSSGGTGSPAPAQPIFKSEKSEYQSFINYNYFLYPSNQNTYYTSSRINLYPDKDESGNSNNYPKNNNNFKSCLTQANVNLKLNIGSDVKRLRIKYQHEFIQIIPQNSTDISNTYIDGVYTYIDIKQKNAIPEKIIPLSIKSIKDCKTDSKIVVLSSDNDVAKEKLAGELIMFANHKNLRKKIKVAIVNCKSNLNGTDTDYSFINQSNPNFIRHLYKVERSLNHSLIEIVQNGTNGTSEPRIENYDLRSIATSNYPNFNNECKIDLVDASNISSKGVDLDIEKTFPGDTEPSNLKEFLRKKIGADLNISSTDYLIVMAINEQLFSEKKGEIIGIGFGKSLIMGKGSFYETDITKPLFVFGHEFLHTLGLAHTFSYSADELNLFMCRFSYSDNLMDYTHKNADPIPATSIWWYQRYFARKNYNQLLT